MRVYLVVIVLLFSVSALAANPVDTCNKAGAGPCTLPCGSVGTAPVQILDVNNRRVELLVTNTGAVTIYVILGHGNAGYDYTYGIPVAPSGQAMSTLDFEVQPDPAKALHTWASTVSVVTQSGTGTCVYGEQEN